MAVTFAVSNLKRNVFGNKRVHTGTLTATGTTTDNGDTAPTAAQIGMHTIEMFSMTATIDSAANPENGATMYYIPSTGKIVFLGGAAAGSAQAALTDGATVTGYACEFQAVGF